MSGSEDSSTSNLVLSWNLIYDFTFILLANGKAGDLWRRLLIGILMLTKIFVSKSLKQNHNCHSWTFNHTDLQNPNFSFLQVLQATEILSWV